MNFFITSSCVNIMAVTMLCPLITFMTLFFFGSYFSTVGALMISYVNGLMSLITMLILMYHHFSGALVESLLMTWFHNMQWGYLANTQTMCMLTLVTSISFLVVIFSHGYMSGQPNFMSFVSYLNLFTFFMNMLVTAPNLCQLFIGWEGVGFCSFLLITFWYTSIPALKAGFLAMFVNKVGDMAFIIGMVGVSLFFGSLNMSEINPQLDQNMGLHIFTVVLLFGSVCAKSAQIGMHIWLPEAMEGPTPVSALIHAATMVTSGVFMLISLSPLFSSLSGLSLVMMMVGSLTALMSSIIGCFCNDLKKVIAYSTCSQLGFMVMIVGFECYQVSMFHLFTHGFFKALLFLSAGSMIHLLGNEQSLEKMGLLGSNTFFESILYSNSTYVITGSFSLCGLPFLSGFYSKDFMIELSSLSGHLFWVYSITLLATALTSYYSVSTFVMVFYQESVYPFMKIFSLGEFSVNWYMEAPLVMLGFASLVFGGIFMNNIMTPVCPLLTSNILKMGATFVTIFGSLFYICYNEIFIYESTPSVKNIVIASINKKISKEIMHSNSNIALFGYFNNETQNNYYNLFLYYSTLSLFLMKSKFSSSINWSMEYMILQSTLWFMLIIYYIFYFLIIWLMHSLFPYLFMSYYRMLIIHMIVLMGMCFMCIWLIMNNLIYSMEFSLLYWSNMSSSKSIEGISTGYSWLESSTLYITLPLFIKNSLGFWFIEFTFMCWFFPTIMSYFMMWLITFCLHMIFSYFNKIIIYLELNHYYYTSLFLNSNTKVMSFLSSYFSEKSLSNLYTFIVGYFSFSVVYNFFITSPLLWLSSTLYSLMDNQFLESYGPTGTKNFSQWWASLTSSLNTGKMFSYIMTVMCFICMFGVLYDCYHFMH